MIDDVKILIDTREKYPYQFIGHDTQKIALKTGDYSLPGLEHIIAIERKSFQDFLGCYSKAYFREQCERLRDMPTGILLMEFYYADIPTLFNANSRLYGAYGSAKGLQGKLENEIIRGSRIHFAGNRKNAESLCKTLLIKAWEDSNKKRPRLLPGLQQTA